MRERLEREAELFAPDDEPRAHGCGSSCTHGGGGGSSSHSGDGGSSSHSGGSSSRTRYSMSPASFRNEIVLLKRELFMLSRELRVAEVVDPPTRQRIVREIAKIELQLMERGVRL